MTWDDFTKKVKEFLQAKKVADSVDTSPLRRWGERIDRQTWTT